MRRANAARPAVGHLARGLERLDLGDVDLAPGGRRLARREAVAVARSRRSSGGRRRSSRSTAPRRPPRTTSWSAARSPCGGSRPRPRSPSRGWPPARRATPPGSRRSAPPSGQYGPRSPAPCPECRRTRRLPHLPHARTGAWRPRRGQGLRWATRANPAHAERARRRGEARRRRASSSSSSADARRGDEGRPSALHRRLHGDPRGRARGVQAHARALRDEVPPLPSSGWRSCCARARHAARGGVRGLRARGVRRRLDRPGAPRGHARRAPRRGQGPVPGRRGGGRDRPAQPPGAAAARQAPRARPRRQGARPGAARADRRGARLRDRGAEPPRGRARLARAPVRFVPPVDTASRAPRARDRADRGQALRGGQGARRGRARPLRRDRLPLLLRTLNHAARGGRPAPRQLPAARRRPRRLPRLRPDAVVDADYLEERGARRPRETRRPCTPRWPPPATCPTRARSSPRLLAQIRTPASGTSARLQALSPALHRRPDGALVSPRSDFYEEMRQETIRPRRC